MTANLLPIIAGVVLAHSPTPDADVRDWCLDTAPRIEDRAAELTCALGTEIVWWDAPDVVFLCNPADGPRRAA